MYRISDFALLRISGYALGHSVFSDRRFWENLRKLDFINKVMIFRSINSISSINRAIKLMALFPFPPKSYPQITGNFQNPFLGSVFGKMGALQQRVPHKEVLQDEEEKFQGPL